MFERLYCCRCHPGFYFYRGHQCLIKTYPDRSVCITDVICSSRNWITHECESWWGWHSRTFWLSINAGLYSSAIPQRFPTPISPDDDGGEKFPTSRQHNCSDVGTAGCNQAEKPAALMSFSFWAAHGQDVPDSLSVLSRIITAVVFPFKNTTSLIRSDEQKGSVGGSTHMRVELNWGASHSIS